jgi:SusD/RagB-like outer membrane lipoprotein/PDZ domain-containing protein
VVYLNPSMLNNRYNQKAFMSPSNVGGAYNSGINLRRVRYADVLLIGAEAAYQTGDIPKAQSYLNQVRARARGTQTVTLGFTPELLAMPIDSAVLARPSGESRVLVRYVNPTSPAFAAGLRSFQSRCVAGCASATIPPVRVDTIDIIRAVDGTAITTVTDYFTAVNSKTPGTNVTLDVLRVRQDSTTGAITTQTLTITIAAQTLLPNVTATGQALLDAIWQERRVELAMEEQRWFDIIRQNGVFPGRAAQLMGAGFAPRDTLYPIPAGEAAIAGLQQNPGY